MSEIKLYQSLVIPEEFSHGFPERHGGVSVGRRGSLNFGSKWGDSKQNVAENLQLLADHVGFNKAQFHSARHVHGTDVLSFGVAGPETYDGIVTDKTNVFVAAKAADCLPMVFADPVSGVCGAAHAGWRGTLGRMGKSMVTEMIKLGSKPSDIRVAIGPSISVGSFETGPELAEKFLREFGKEDGLVVMGPQKEHVNLQLAARLCLLECGVLDERIDWTPPDTMTNEDRFFSYRRDGKDAGIHMGFIARR